jgi:hypothetical protein
VHDIQIHGCSISHWMGGLSWGTVLESGGFGCEENPTTPWYDTCCMDLTGSFSCENFHGNSLYGAGYFAYSAGSKAWINVVICP